MILNQAIDNFSNHSFKNSLDIKDFDASFAKGLSLEDGSATFEVPDGLDENFPDGTFSGSLPLPQVLTLGVAYRPTEKLTFVLDMNRGGWKA